MKIIELYTKYTLAKIAFVKKHKKIFVIMLFICVLLFATVFLSLFFFNYQMLHLASDSQSKTDVDSGQQQIDYKETTNTLVTTSTSKTKEKKEIKVAESKLNTASIEEKTDTYKIKLTFPKIPSSDNSASFTNETIKKYFENNSNDFKKDVADSVADLLKENRLADFPGRLSEYDSDTTVIYEDDNLISYFVSEFYDLIGTAHPGHVISTFVYDKQKGKLLTLSDVFVVNDFFYKKIASLIAIDIGKQMAKASEVSIKAIDIKSIEEGLSKKEKSFRNFTLSDKGVTFYFGEYVLGSYVDGEQQSFLSFETLKEFKK